MIKLIVEKPDEFISNTIVSGIYFYTNDVVKLAKDLKPSKRGELEITDLNNIYLRNDKLKLVNMKSKISWLDTGTYDSLLAASEFVIDVQTKSGKKFGCVEEMALEMGYIDVDQFFDTANEMRMSKYGSYLLNQIKNENK